MVNCHICDFPVGNIKNMKRHIQSKHSDLKPFSCEQCNFKAKRKDHITRHINEVHQNNKRELITQNRSRIPTTSSNVARHQSPISTPASTPSNVDAPLSFDDINYPYEMTQTKALDNGIFAFRIFPTQNDPQLFLSSISSQIDDVCKRFLSQHSALKLQMCLTTELFKPVEPSVKCTPGFRICPLVVLRSTNIQDELSVLNGTIMEKIAQFLKEGSGWSIQTIKFLEIQLTPYQPFSGSTFKELPRHLKNKHAIINIINTDQKCFLWSVLAHIFPAASNPNRVENYIPYENRLNLKNIKFPMTIHDVTIFENQNDYAINIFGFENGGIFPIRISKHLEERTVIHLMLFNEHYSLISNFNSLLYDQTRHKCKKFFCFNCLMPQSSPENLKDHNYICRQFDPVRVKLPKDKTLSFSNVHRTLRQPLVIYADFECLTEPIDTCSPSSLNSSTTPYQKHTPCGYGLMCVRNCCTPPLFTNNNCLVYRGPDCIKRFLIEVNRIAKDYQQFVQQNRNNIIGFDPSIHAGNVCHVCKTDIVSGKVKEHCHICGTYRGPAHSNCNLGYRLSNEIVVVFHNLRKYDGHIIMKEVGTIAKQESLEISVIAKAMEDYISFSLYHKQVKITKKRDNTGKTIPSVKQDTSQNYKIRFIDSMQFLNNSLANLTANLDVTQLHALKSKYSGTKLELLVRKGVYPYCFMNSWEKFNLQHLPEASDFYNKLDDTHISQEDYQHALKVWNEFSISTMGAYHDLYLETDVLLLTDIFENFRTFCLINYKLDPAHYLTLPSFALDACLKMTNVKIELIQESDMYIFFESAIRGGISQISHRYAKANNPLLPDYKPQIPNSYIIYLDANNLYGWAMNQPLPINGFRWLDEASWKQIQWHDLSENEAKAYVLEVDLDYPKQLHNLHNLYPLAPEKLTIAKVSPYGEFLQDSLNFKIFNNPKLITSLWAKHKYILHSRVLKLYLKHGLILKKIYRVLEFNQKAWMQPYILFNTEKRKNAKNSFEKDLFKLLNNAVFGKTMENVRKYRNIELVTSASRLNKLVSNPRFRSSQIFTKDLVGVASLQPSTMLCKPIFCGMTILDLSKYLMYSFHYEYIIPKYGENATLLFTDTDSLCYKIYTENIYEDMKCDSDMFDLSDFNKLSKFYDDRNKKKIGKMKDETSGEPIVEFCGLRSKMYSILLLHEEKKRAKGVKKQVVKKRICHEDYLNTLFNECPMRHGMNLIRSHNHEIYSETVNKISLNPYDDKRWLLNPIASLAHGHFQVQPTELHTTN